MEEYLTGTVHLSLLLSFSYRQTYREKFHLLFSQNLDASLKGKKKKKSQRTLKANSRITNVL